MRKIILFSLTIFIFNTVLSQISFDNKVDIYDEDRLGIRLIYDDFDNDGDLDIVKKSDSNYSENILLQLNVNGDFNDKVSKYIATYKNPIISLDLNNDNYPDLITYESYSTIGVLYNLQNDTFSEEIETLLSFSGSYSIHPIKFDYNIDGFMDLIVIDDTDDVYVLLNNQVSGFEQPQFLVSVGYWDSIYKIDDFDNDGDFDLYIKDGNYLRVYINNNGTFDHPNILQSNSSLDSFGILDFDDNGYKDILYWKSGSLWVKYFNFDENIDEFVVDNDTMVIENIPYYTYSNSENSIFIENEGSGNYAIYAALEISENQHNIYKTDFQNGVFSNSQIVLSNFEVNIFNLFQFRFLDIDNDGELDFSFTTDFNNRKMIFINYNINDASDKTICIQQSIWANIFSVIDMNGDGIEDICVGTQNGLGYFEKTTNNELGDIRNLIGVMSNPNASAFTMNNIMDFNNDELGDVIDFVNYGENVKVFKNSGNDNFDFVQSLPILNGTKNIFFIDIDSDNFIDLVFQSKNYSTGNYEFNWAKNNNGVNFEGVQPLVLNNIGQTSDVSLAFDDFNDDGQTDILLLSNYFDYGTGQHKNEIVLLENENGQFFGTYIAFFDSYNALGNLKIKDFDQDEDLDFFVYINHGEQPFLLFKNDGQNNFSSLTIENINIEDIEFDDNDGDGLFEIYAWYYDRYDYISYIFYYATADNVNFDKIEIDSYTDYYGGVYDTWGDLLLYDYNYDNKKDLFIDNFNSNDDLISVYKNLGTIGIEELENDNNLFQLKIYPNPFLNTISWNGEENKKYIASLYSLNGKLLLKKVTSKNSFNLSSFESGIYILVIEDENLVDKNTYKIIKK